jgi:hypothetical protein
MSQEDRIKAQEFMNLQYDATPGPWIDDARLIVAARETDLADRVIRLCDENDLLRKRINEAEHERDAAITLSKESEDLNVKQEQMLKGLRPMQVEAEPFGPLVSLHGNPPSTHSQALLSLQQSQIDLQFHVNGFFNGLDARLEDLSCRVGRLEKSQGKVCDEKND